MTLEENIEEKSQEDVAVEQKHQPPQKDPDPEDNDPNKCVECGGRLEMDGTGEKVCKECGLVAEQLVIDQGEDWRDYGEESDKKRIHAQRSSAIDQYKYDKGLGSKITGAGKISRRARNQQKWSLTQTSKARSLKFAEETIKKYTELPRDIREAGLVNYKTALDANLTSTNLKEVVIAACLYAACRQCNVPRGPDEIADMVKFPGVNRYDIMRIYGNLSRKLGWKLKPTSPEDYVKRFCSNAGKSENIVNRTFEILKEATLKGLTNGRAPQSVAASAIYISGILCGDRTTEREIADISGVTEITVRDRYKELAYGLGLAEKLGLPPKPQSP